MNKLSFNKDYMFQHMEPVNSPSNVRCYTAVQCTIVRVFNAQAVWPRKPNSDCSLSWILFVVPFLRTHQHMIHFLIESHR